MKVLALLIFSFLSGCVFAQKNNAPKSTYNSKVWVSDNGNGTYKNPILHADYSDPDVIRVDSNYYMISSSFDAVPGIPILQSNDLVNWKIIGHVFQAQIPIDHFSKVQHGNGVWAPAIRYHNKEFYIYYPDPDFGIYLTKSKKIIGPWSAPVLVDSGKGLIDPCPLWDDNGNVYMAHAYAGSRAGIKSILVIKKLNAAGDKVIDHGKLVYDGHELDPTIEGPKLYKRNGYYYIFAPAGGVSTGWQLVLRSKNIYGPYERKIVMHQGSTTINGPHQGAWINTLTGEDWFIHFQDIEAYGRVVHLQPMQWKNDWPIIGLDADKDGVGEPVLVYKKPNVGKKYPIETPIETDYFDGNDLGLQWQWQANPKATWHFLDQSKKSLRLYAIQSPEGAKNVWEIPNVLLQKFPAEEFTTTTKVNFQPRLKGEKLGLIVMGLDYAHINLEKTDKEIVLKYSTCLKADKQSPEKEKEIKLLSSGSIYLRVTVKKNAICTFSYSEDGITFTDIEDSFTAKPGKWIGAKVGLFCTRSYVTNDSGFADIDWFKID